MGKKVDFINDLPDWSKLMGCLLLNLSLGVADYRTPTTAP